MMASGWRRVMRGGWSQRRERRRGGSVAMAMRCEKTEESRNNINLLRSLSWRSVMSALIERRAVGHMCHTGMLAVRFWSHLSKLCR